MVTLKCKICGGNIIPQGELGTCDSCGTKVSLAGASDDRLIENRNRANEARMKQDYAAAQRAWGRIVSDEPQNAEAHWNLALSRYGIDYAWDEQSADFYPVINLLRYEPFLEDPDYRAAMQYADENAIVYYMNEGERISGLQARSLELIRNEKEYDVFLCFNTAASGPAAEGTRYAKEIYEALTQKGLHVFYEPETLAEHAGKNLEPYIFSALYSSRVMVLLATQAEQLTDTWVKNEWTRFLQQMDEDQHKHLIPVYAHMQPEFFPDEIIMREAVDLTAGGSMMDLVRGVLRLTGKDNTSGSYAEVVRIKQLMAEKLEAGEFQEVRRLGNEAVAILPEEADVWYTLFLAENRCHDEFELTHKEINWYDSPTFAKAYELASRRRRSVLEEVKANWEEYQKRLSSDKEFAEAEKQNRAALEKAAKDATALMSLGEYKKAYQLLTDNPTVTDEIAALRDESELGTEYARIDPKRYLEDKLKAEKPGALQAFKKMTEPLHRSTSTGGVWSAGPVLVGSLLTAIYGIWMTIASLRRVYASEISNLVLVVGVILVAYGIATKFIDKTGIKIFVSLFVAGGAMSVYAGGMDTTTVTHLILTAVCLLLAYLSYRDLGKQGKGLSVKCAKYYDAEIRPLESKWIAEYQKKYALLNKYQPLKELVTVWQNYME